MPLLLSRRIMTTHDFFCCFPLFTLVGVMACSGNNTGGSQATTGGAPGTGGTTASGGRQPQAVRPQAAVAPPRAALRPRVAPPQAAAQPPRVAPPQVAAQPPRVAPPQVAAQPQGRLRGVRRYCFGRWEHRSRWRCGRHDAIRWRRRGGREDRLGRKLGWRFQHRPDP